MAVIVHKKASDEIKNKVRSGDMQNKLDQDIMEFKKVVAKVHKEYMAAHPEYSGKK